MAQPSAADSAAAMQALGSLRFIDSAKAPLSVPRSTYTGPELGAGYGGGGGGGGVGGSPRKKGSRAFNSTASRFDYRLRQKGAAIGPGAHSPGFIDGRTVSTSIKGTGAFADGRHRFGAESSMVAPGPGSHEIAGDVASHKSFSRAATTANYAAPVAHKAAVFDPRLNQFRLQSNDARGVYTKTGAPSPSTYNVRQPVVSRPHKGKGGTGVFKSKSERKVQGMDGNANPGPAETSHNTRNTGNMRTQSTATAAMRAKSRRFGGNGTFVPPPGTYSPSTDYTKTRSPYGKQDHRELVPHHRQKFTLQHAPPAKAKNPGPAAYNLRAPDVPKFTDNSPMFKSQSHRTKLEQDLARMQRQKGTPGPGSYMQTGRYGNRYTATSMARNTSHHNNPEKRWI